MSDDRLDALNALFVRALTERVRAPERLGALAAELQDRAGPEPDWLARADILHGWSQAYRGSFAEAQATAQRAFAVLEPADATAGSDAARDLWSTCLIARGRFSEALDVVTPTLAHAPSSRSPAEWCISYGRLATVNERLGDFDEALRWHYRAVAAARDSGDTASQAMTLGSLGGLQLSLQNMDDAAALLESAWALIGEDGREWVHAWSVVAMNWLMVLTLQCRFEQALPLAETLVLAEPRLPPGMRSRRQLLLAHLFSQAGQLERAQRFLDEGRRLCSPDSEPPVEWVWVQAHVWNSTHRHAQAWQICRDHFEAAAAGRLPEVAMPEDLMRLHNEATRAQEALDDLAGALRSQRAMIEAEREMARMAAGARRKTLQIQFELEMVQRDRDDAQQREQAAAREQARLAELNAALRSASEAKTRFLAAASHDLRQPVQALTMTMAALKLEADEGSRLGLMRRMGQSLDALSSMFDGLLDVSRLDAGMVDTNLASLRLVTLLERLVDEHRPSARALGLDLRLHVPESAALAGTCTDALLLERCLRNLIDNAIKYTGRGGVIVRLRAAAGDVPAWRIEVRDSGPGLDPELHERVFEEFFQVGNEERDRAKGLGLGLSIVRRLCGLLGHPLGLRSSPGRGSRFSIDVPQHELPVADESEPAAAQSPTRALTLLVIDDDMDIRHSMAALLERWGHRVHHGADVVEALAAWRQAGQSRLDGAIVDLRLRGGLTGLQVISQLRHAVTAGLPSLVITGDIAPARIAELNAAAQPWLSKPVLPMRLRSWLNGVAQPSTQATPARSPGHAPLPGR